jgi:hypothetical protein
MTFIAYDPLLGKVDLAQIDPVGPGPVNLVAGTGSGRMSFSFETIRGYDANLGGADFVFAQYSATIVAGTVVQFNQTLVNGAIVNSAAAWAGTANSGDILAVAVAPTGSVGQWGWFQIGGNAITTVSGAPVAGNPVYWQAAGVVSPTVVGGKQVLGAKFATAPAITLGTGASAIVLSGTQAVVTLEIPTAQSQIT